MYGVEFYGLVRRAVMLEGLSHRAAALRFGIDRGTVAKIIAHPTPPGYQRKIPVRRPKLADHEGFIEQILVDDERAPAKQRHTARRIFERLRDERGFDGGYAVSVPSVSPPCCALSPGPASPISSDGVVTFKRGSRTLKGAINPR